MNHSFLSQARPLATIILFLFTYIGQAHSQEQLEIEGAIIIGESTDSTPSNGTIEFDGSEFLGRTGGFWKSLSAATSPWTESGSIIYFNQSGGQVGIGTSSPTTKLHLIHDSANYPHLQLEEVKDGKDSKIVLSNSTNITNRWIISGQSSLGADQEIGWFFNASPKLVYDKTNSGLGLNTENPLATFQMFDNTKDTIDFMMTPYTNGGKHSKIIMAEDSDATFNMSWLYEGDANIMQLFGEDNGVIYGPHFQVKRNSGNAAFGDTFATGYKLTVDGKIMCEELQVLLKADWPDYVFEQEYELMPLPQLRDYLSEHKHLPGIPTAVEVSEEGIAVGEMQKMMMEKIEELTLYLLELEEEVAALKSENANLKK